MSRACRIGHLIGMLRMRRRQNYRVEVGMRQSTFEIVAILATKSARERFRIAGITRCARNDLRALRQLLQRFGQFRAPPAQPDNPDLQHSKLTSALDRFL